jgi:hypothetical protein
LSYFALFCHLYNSFCSPETIKGGLPELTTLCSFIILGFV